MKKRILSLLLCLFLLPLPALADYESELGAFPRSWQKKLSVLHEKYPDWVFVAVDTGLSWDAVVEAEMGKKSLVEKYYSPLLRNTAPGHYNPDSGTYTYHDASTWVSASRATVDYFLNPVNFLNEIYIFQFEALSYDDTYHTIDGVELILQGTFMHQALITYVTAGGETVETEKTYAEVIMEAAEKSLVSPYYLASKIRTEIGIHPSGSVTGTYEGFPGIYNFYNIGANDGKNPIANGLNWASLGNSYGRPWTSPEISIINGAIWIGELYISKGQNTMYFERFNVAPESGYKLFTHQYMTNVYGAAGQAFSTYTGYESADTLSDAKVFYIPIYEDMPGENTKVSFSALSEQTGLCTAASGMNVRGGPSVNYGTVGRLAKGEKVTLLSGTRTDSEDRMHMLENPYWYEIETDDFTGYVSSTYIDIEESAVLAPGESFALLPETDKNAGILYWENMNRNVAEVDEDGLVTAKKSGTAVIRAFTSGGGMATVKIVVSGSFSDMRAHWAKDVVDKVVDLGLFTGTSDTEFSPDLEMTRSMYITVLCRLYTLLSGKTPKADPLALPYLDITPEDWYAPSVAWAYEEDLLPFEESAMFSPSAPMTRGEMAISAYKLSALLGEKADTDTFDEEEFADFADLPPQLSEAAAWCVSAKVLRGMGDGTLGMEKTATRAQVAQIAVNLHTALGAE